MPDISLKLHENSFSRNLYQCWQIQIQKIEKSILESQCFNRNILLMSDPCCKFHGDPFICFPVVLLTGTDFHENIQKETLYSRGLTWQPHMFQFVYCIMPDLSRKCHENPCTRFPAMLLTDRQANLQTNKQRWKHNLHRWPEVINNRVYRRSHLFWTVYALGVTHDSLYRQYWCCNQDYGILVTGKSTNYCPRKKARLILIKPWQKKYKMVLNIRTPACISCL